MRMRNAECGMGFSIQRKRFTSDVSRITIYLLFTVHCSLFTLTGCAATPKKEAEKPAIPVSKEEPRTAGSLWAGETSKSSFFVDTRARRAGDVVTIRVSENSKGSKSATTGTSRKSSTSAGITNLFGTPLDLGFDKLYGGAGFSPTVTADSDSSFKGDGNTSRSSLLEADITARITDVLPSGNLSIEGRREIVVNNEEQIMVLKGVIRPEDISSSNVVLSTYIADARIEYTGEGVLADRQGPGWLTRILDKVWPF